MKALSLRQPWAHAVVHYGKNIENRRWNTAFRGTFLIHASKYMTRDEYDETEEFIADTLGWHAGGSSGIADMASFKANFEACGQRGGIIGIADLVGVIPPCRTGEPSLFAESCAHKWHIPEQYGFLLDNVRPLPFVPLRGQLQFFDVPARVAEACMVAT